MYNFHDTLFKGNIFKELIKVLFEKSGYIAIPFGYETQLTTIKAKLSKAKRTKTALKIRSSPDLLIFDNKTEDVTLVECKMSSYPSPRLNQERLEDYREFWEDAILVMVVPFENVFYAQQIHNMGFKKQYDPRTDFKKIQEIFPRITEIDVKKYGNIACNLISSLNNKICNQR